MRRHVEDRDAVCVHDDPVHPRVLAVEDDLVPVDSPDRDVALLGWHDVPTRVRAGSEHDRVARLRAFDRELEGRCIIGHTDFGGGGGWTRGGDREQSQRRRQR